MSHPISTVSARAKLKARREPYWHRLNKGFYLGFRKMTPTSQGQWIIRSMDDNAGKETYKTLGEFADLAPADRFDAACKEAGKILGHFEKGGITKAKTVQDTCDAYVKHLRSTKTEKAAMDAQKRFASYVLDDVRFAKMEISRLVPATIDTWRQALIERPTTSGGNRGEKRTTSTLNRDMTPFRAALNHAFESGWVTTDFAWRGKLKPIEGADKKRDLYLDRKQRIMFIDKAAPDLAMFLRAMATLPIRPGALSNLKAGDFDARLMALKIKDKTGQRTIKLPSKSAEIFKLAVKDKLPTAPLLARADGSAWNKDSWKYPIKDAAVAAKMPAGTTAYTMRHSIITDLVHGGLDLLTVAQISGTSVRMIEKHYGRLRGDIAVNALSALAI